MINPINPKEYKAVALRECLPLPSQTLCDTPEAAVSYWALNIACAGNVHFNPSVETLIVLCLNARRRILGHHVVSTGTLDTILVHPREVFRVAIMVAAAAIICMHNHPSGDPTPSEADVKVTRDLIRAGQLLKIECLDHVIVGTDQPKCYRSLRELGYFCEGGAA